ncbi:hypothetical protein H0H93_008126 [Arthromyces matolae]|nr:hypothetical protein H0H93_008126 [Arthromyces matolae]
MRQKRAKTYRKLMSLYAMTFGFRQPYQVLVDSEILKTGVEHKIELVRQLGTVLQGEVKPKQQPSVDLAKTFERRKCNHREPIPGDDCLMSVVGLTNKHRYVIATQSQPLRVKLRNIPAVPIVHINRSVMILEPPSDLTLETKASIEAKALQPTASEMSLTSSRSAEAPKKKIKGPKGPNPLSVKKKKIDSQKTFNPQETILAEKRKRDDSDESQHERTEVDDDASTSRPTKKRRRRKKGNGTLG